jgi:hypothetical protein
MNEYTKTSIRYMDSKTDAVFKQDEMGRECSMHKTDVNSYKTVVRKPEENISLRRLGHTWEGNINRVGRCGMELSDQWQALVSTKMNHLVP